MATEPYKFAKFKYTRGRPLIERFMEKVAVTDGCWEWQAALNRGGYGKFQIETHRTTTAHRAAYELLVGPVPEGLTIDHLCRNKTCVNPGHMEPVPMGVNVLRGNSWSGINSRKTHCKNGHEFAGDNLVLSGSQGRARRACRACLRSADARFKAKRRAAS